MKQQIAYARENSSFYSYLPEKPLESLVSEGVVCKESLMREVQEKLLGELRMEELAVLVETVDEIAFTGKRFVR